MSPYSGSGRPTGTDFFSGRTTPMSVPPSGRATPQSVYAWSGPETQEVSAVNLSMSDTEVLAALAEQATSQLLEQGQRIVATALVDSKMAITDLQTAIESAPTYKQAILALDETSRMVAAQHAALQEALEASAAVQALLNSRELATSAYKDTALALERQQRAMADVMGDPSKALLAKLAELGLYTDLHAPAGATPLAQMEEAMTAATDEQAAAFQLEASMEAAGRYTGSHGGGAGAPRSPPTTPGGSKSKSSIVISAREALTKAIRSAQDQLKTLGERLAQMAAEEVQKAVRLGGALQS